MKKVQVNKKAILGMVVSMVLSLGVMNGINKSNVKHNDTSLQQIALYFDGHGSEGARTYGQISGGVMLVGLALGNPVVSAIGFAGVL